MNPGTWQERTYSMSRALRDDTSPKSLSILQLHVTERCNKSCVHCYQDVPMSASSEMTTDQLLSVIDSYQKLCSLRSWSGRIVFSGGEPFVRDDFMYVLQETKRWSDLKIGILTNGSCIDETIAIKLKERNPHFVQISLEGHRETHDHIRGRGDFIRCLNVLSLLHRVGLRTVVSFTAHRANYRDFSAVAKYVRKAGVKELWADRLVPIGRGSELKTLSPDESRMFFELMLKERNSRHINSETKVMMRRSLQFLVSGEFPYQCTAGKSLLAVLPNGVAYPCRRLPITLGNVLTTSLTELFQRGRSVCDSPSACKRCEHLRQCNGGARCITYASLGNLADADPGCWLRHKNGEWSRPCGDEGNM